MRRVMTVGAAFVLVIGMGAFVAGCGDNDETTTTTEVVTDDETVPTEPTTTTAEPTTTTAETTTSTASGPNDCTDGEVYSQVSGTCIEENKSGNPCPPGQVPMADEPVCVAKD